MGTSMAGAVGSAGAGWSLLNVIVKSEVKEPVGFKGDVLTLLQIRNGKLQWWLI